MAVGPKPDLMNYHGVGASDRLSSYQRYKDDTLVWCAEAMQDAAETISRALTEQRLDGMLKISPGRRVRTTPTWMWLIFYVWLVGAGFALGWGLK